ncbi:glycerophosphodiester phosphodiesterase [Microbulbifer sp.]|uniref:glycerophosphodiester phosphodiesterase n=1 Tax=Microbulbifer sp. TaxID=1908541 RepID=UPI003F3C1AC8
MIRRTLPLCLSLVLILAAGSAHATLVIAHRGASGYLPEHTLEAKALAYAMRPDYIEQDLVLSKDNRLIVMHDIYLDGITDVAQVFPGRVRKDGHYYTIDFTLAELKRLRVTEAFRNKNGNIAAKYPRRFPLWQSSFQLSTLEEEIELIQGLNKTLGYDIGIYPEIKNPAFHRREGRDIAVLTLVKLKQYGYTGRSKKIFLQCFDAEELQRIKRELMPQLKMDLPLVQLIAKKDDHDWMLQPGGLEKIAIYADAIGPWMMMMIDLLDDNQLATTDLVQRAHRNNLVVHPYTFRADSKKIPQQIGSFERLLELFIDQLNVDGLFTDHPDKAVEFISRGSR